MEKSVEQLLHTLLDREPLIYVDIGARGGFTELRGLEQWTEAYGFEPDPDECSRLNANHDFPVRFRKVRFIPKAVWSFCGSIELSICRSPGNSSVYIPDRDVLASYGDSAFLQGFDIVRTIKCPVVTLDAFAQTENLQYIDYLKIDAQGGEYEILRGGGSILKSVLVARLEVMFAPMYRQQPLLRDVDSFMSKNGFWLIALESHYPKSIRSRAALPANSTDRGEWIWADAIYTLNPHGRRDYLDSLLPSRVVKLMLILSDLGFNGLAIDTARRFGQRRFHESEAVGAFAAAIAKACRQTPTRRLIRISRALARRLGFDSLLHRATKG